MQDAVPPHVVVLLHTPVAQYLVANIGRQVGLDKGADFLSEGFFFLGETQVHESVSGLMNRFYGRPGRAGSSLPNPAFDNAKCTPADRFSALKPPLAIYEWRRPGFAAMLAGLFPATQRTAIP
jgi:hypothetical protein